MRSILFILFLASMVACAAPARRLPKRIVDTPMSLPDNMASIEMQPRIRISDRKLHEGYDPFANWVYALTNRLELRGLLALRYTFLDDAPTGEGGPAKDPFSLSLEVGVSGAGYSSLEGWLLWPSAEIHARKRIGRSAYVFGRVSALGRWASRDGWQGFRGGPKVGVLSQLTALSAVELSVAAYREQHGRMVYTNSVDSLEAGLGWLIRPAHWLQLGPWLGLASVLRTQQHRHAPTPETAVPAQASQRVQGVLGFSSAFFW